MTIDMTDAEWQAIANAKAIELWQRGESPEAIHAAVTAEAERIVRTWVAAVKSPILRGAMAKLLEEGIAHADQP